MKLFLKPKSSKFENDERTGMMVCSPTQNLTKVDMAVKLQDVVTFRSKDAE